MNQVNLTDEEIAFIGISLYTTLTIAKERIKRGDKTDEPLVDELNKLYERWTSL